MVKHTYSALRLCQATFIEMRTRISRFQENLKVLQSEPLRELILEKVMVTAQREQYLSYFHNSITIETCT